MNIYELKKHLSNKYPDKEITLALDKNCVSQLIVSVRNNEVCLFGHVVFKKVRVEVEGEEPYYEIIKNHRETISFKELKEKINDLKDIYVGDDLHEFMESMKPQEQEEYKKQLCNEANLSIDDLEKKIEAARKGKEKESKIKILRDK